jgi:glycosyltransferase involved in cell wall biosynthesis
LSPLRVLFLAPQPFFEVRGTPLAVRALVRTLGELGHHVDLLTYPQGQPATIPGVTHRRSLPLPVGRVRPGFSVAKLLLDGPFAVEACARMATGRYDVVHAVEEAAHLCAPFARMIGLPLIADVDSAIPDQLRERGAGDWSPLVWAADHLERFALARAVAVVTVCTSLTDRVKARAPAARVFQIEDPPLAAGAGPGPEAVAALRAELGLDARPVALYSGNFEPYQGVDLLAAAAALAPEVQVVFMGGEPAEIATLSSMARPAEARWVFTGKRPPEDLATFLALSDVLVSPRRQGVNTPFKVYTYLAAGKPLVATRIATHTQLLDDTTAFLVEPNAAGLAAGIRDALSSSGEAARRAEAGRRLIERDYSAARYTEKVRAAYEEVARRIDTRPS